MGSIPRLVIAGTQSGVGKTTLSLGIMGALRKRGVKLQPFKVGPDYIDPQFHRRMTGVASRNLDAYLLEEHTLRGLFLRNTQDKEIAVVEGVMGLYDGIGTQGHQGSTAHVAKLLKAPVVLIINGSGLSNSAAALVRGYRDYDPEVWVAGVIINQVSGEKHYQLLKEIIEENTGIPCFGYLSKSQQIGLQSRHLGLIPTEEVEALEEKLQAMASMVEETVDMEGLIALANQAEPFPGDGFQGENPLGPLEKPLRIGYALDEAFHFYYEDNLDLLRSWGVTLVPFSPLRDPHLPEDLHGLYLGGGFPEVFASQLEANESLRAEIKETLGAGLPFYGECGGYMYLTESITTFEGTTHQMVGILQGKARMTNRLQHFGYNEIQFTHQEVFHSPIGKLRGHEFHRGVVEAGEPTYAYDAVKIRNDQMIDRWHCGGKKFNGVAGFSHLHFYSNLEFPRAFVTACLKYQQQQSNEEEKDEPLFHE